MRQNQKSIHLLGGLFLAALLPLIGPSEGQAQPGIIAGDVVDRATGDPLVGAYLFLKDTGLGAVTGIEGDFRIPDVPPGTYEVESSMIGYNTLTVTEVVVAANEVLRLDLVLTSEAIAVDEVVVEVRALRNTEASLLKERQKAPAVSDAISSEDISRAGSGDAAEAMSHVTGATVMEGKYVYIRGLGDRYSTVQLNGAALPSADPNRRAVPMDLFPSSMLENIVTVKSFTPDKPGNFTGGAVNIGTRSFPDDFTLSVSASTTFNTQSSFQGGFLTYEGGRYDWLGMDDGTRDLPDQLARGEVQIPDIGEAYGDQQSAETLNQLSESFSPVMAPESLRTQLSNGNSFAVGNQVSLLGNPLGFLGSISYSRKLAHYDGGKSGRWQLTGSVDEVKGLNNNFLLDDTRSAEEVLWGSLLSAAYRFRPEHEIGVSYIYNRNGEDVARYLSGPFPRDLPDDGVYETRVLHFVEREIRSGQVRGKHLFKGLGNLRIDWTGSRSQSTQEEPDLRFFTDNYRPRVRNGKADTLYSIQTAIYPYPTRYFRDLEEVNTEGQIDFTLPFKQWDGLLADIKFGGNYLSKDRGFRERRYEFRNDDIKYDGDAFGYFSDANVGLTDTTSSLNRFGNYVVDATQLSSNYDGEQQIYAGYGMMEIPLTPSLRAIAGARFEATRMEVASKDTARAAGNLETDDILPSVNLVYQVGESNLRLAYGRTLARPTFRELAPYASFDFVGDFILIGNENLERTLIDNYDLRWEWFPRPGEIYAVSGFLKQFDNPIERAILTINGQVQYQNVDEARVMGIEFEARKALADLGDRWSNFFAGANLALVHSQVTIPPTELTNLRALDPGADDSRSLQGQSPYVFNLDLTYDNFEKRTAAGLYFNLFGRRLSEVSLGGTPNVYEEPRPTLDFTLSKGVNHLYKIKFSARNLLDSAVEKVYPFADSEYIARQYRRGRSFGIGLSYSLD